MRNTFCLVVAVVGAITAGVGCGSATLPPTGGTGGAGKSGSGGAAGSGGLAATGGAGGIAGMAGAGAGGVAGTGGAPGTGGVAGTGGVGGTGGVAGHCGSRDCTSSNDNDCNGQPDNTETSFCKCSPANSPRSCSTGLLGICMAGSQVCGVSADKTTSDWGGCTQLKPKGTETCANPGTDDDCDGVADNVPLAPCNVGTGLGACANGGYTACSGLTQVCNAATSSIGDATMFHVQPAPNGSWDWDCDGVVEKQYPDTAPSPPSCSGLSMSDCPNQPVLYYALNPFACGDMGDIGSFSCYWLSAIPGCTNKSGQSTGFQQGCR